MARGIGATNITEVDGTHYRPVSLVSLAFDTPVYVHSAIGNITYNGDVYLGVGDLGNIIGIAESEAIAPSPIQLTLSGIEDAYVTEAFDAGNYGDVITIYEGYRGEENELVADPWVAAGGIFEFASLKVGSQNNITITMQHDLARLQERSSRRYTQEDQQNEFSADTGFNFVTDVPVTKLVWGGRSIGGKPTGGTGGPGGSPRERDEEFDDVVHE